jgi:low affinity Fe/Cu permease
MNKFFSRLASFIANKTGSWQAFVIALVVVASWIVTGPLFDFSDSWQLYINTGTTVVTFLMVFLIQNEQNRNDEVLHKKLDYLVKALSKNSEEYEDIDEID